MRAYVGQTRSRTLLRRLEALDIGECVVRGELPPRRSRWFYDNGAYGDHAAGRGFDLVQFGRDLRAIRAGGKGAGRSGRLVDWRRPDFLVLPDLVGGGLESLRLSLEWATARELPPGVPLYLAVQDGMSLRDISQAAAGAPLGGLFVGGSLDWKLKTGASWVEHGHDLGLPVHVGRVGTVDRVRWARDIGADSIDSALPLWSEAQLGDWLEALTEEPAPKLF